MEEGVCQNLYGHAIWIFSHKLLLTLGLSMFSKEVFNFLLSLHIESVHVKNGRGRKMDRSSNFFGPVHFSKWTAFHFSDPVQFWIISIGFLGQKTITCPFFWTSVHFKKWTGPKKIGRPVHFRPRPFLTWTLSSTSNELILRVLWITYAKNAKYKEKHGNF